MNFEVLFTKLLNITALFLASLSLGTTTPKSIQPETKIQPQYGLYSTVWTAHSKRIHQLIDLADGQNGINALVIDVKDDGVYLDSRVKDLVDELHRKNIYAIARIIVFQDNLAAQKNPDWAFKKQDGALWQDKRGWYWLDPSKKETWDYNLDVAKKAIDYGFDEVNFDYVRFPAFLKSDDVVIASSTSREAKNDIIHNFSKYLTTRLKEYRPNINLSVDIFAQSLLKADDLGVGQLFTELYDDFDYVSPMVYPSHYAPGNFGFDNPAEHPYDIVFGTLEAGKNQLREKIILHFATTTPGIIDPAYNEEIKKLRPWLQYFSLGAVYDENMINQEKKAVYDAGITSGWLFWNPKNVYTRGALDK